MTHVWAVVLGFVQGVAEFLPISSTAHLKLVPWIFEIQKQYPVLASAQFDIALHAGSFVAILLALWGDWVGLLRSAVQPARPRKRRDAGTTDADNPFRDPSSARRFIGFLLATSIPGAIIGVLFDSKIEKYSSPLEFHFAPLLIGVALILFGVLLWAVDRYVGRQDPLAKMTWGKAALIGLAQAAALLPGVSRSGATMTTGRALGLSRDATARYSFMAALPIIGGAALFGLRDVPLNQLLSLDWVLGFIAAAASSLLFMRLMLSYVRKHSFAVFMWYRIALGVFVIALFFLRG
ncbi:MAG: undecaprenyl-diphosphate phosphatase [Coriobacteriia bacterium]|nr:undecaprenyl-diphosphate phosphatase [Coriobacteriia bacterium]